MKWDEIQRAVMEFERKGPVAQEEIDDLSNNERRKNISSNPFLVAHHFHSRVTTILSYLITSQSLGKYRVKDFFYRVEFQLRGKIALHLTHSNTVIFINIISSK